MYQLKKIGEITPPCFTPFDTLTYSDLLLFQRHTIFVLNNYQSLNELHYLEDLRLKRKSFL